MRFFLYILSGLILGLLPLWWCFVLAGGGHGTNIPFCLFYGPAMMFRWLGFAAIVSAVLLYVIYAAILYRCRRSRKYRLHAISYIISFHYLFALLAYITWPWDENHMEIFRSGWQSHPTALLLLGGLFLAYNGLAIYILLESIVKRKKNL